MLHDPAQTSKTEKRRYLLERGEINPALQAFQARLCRPQIDRDAVLLRGVWQKLPMKGSKDVQIPHQLFKRRYLCSIILASTVRAWYSTIKAWQSNKICSVVHKWMTPNLPALGRGHGGSPFGKGGEVHPSIAVRRAERLSRVRVIETYFNSSSVRLLHAFRDTV